VSSSIRLTRRTSPKSGGKLSTSSRGYGRVGAGELSTLTVALANSHYESEPPLVTEQELQIGYRGATACAAAGITYRQLDYWARTGLVEPSIRTAHGSGSARLYGFRDILVLKIVKRLLDAGVSLQNIRTAVDHLRNRGVVELERITLMSDGASIYECSSPDEIVDLLAGGQGVFGIAVGKVWHEVEGSLSTLAGEFNGETVGGEGNDELSLRRKAKGA
jgi:DNA-binding transcriptional MerR regulator